MEASHLIRCLFYTKPSQSHSVGHRPGRFNDIERRQSARDLGAGMLTIHCRSCAKRDERWLEIAVSPKLETMFEAPVSRMRMPWGLSEEAIWECLWRWQRETQESSCPTVRGGTSIIWTWQMQADRLLAITMSSGSCLHVPGCITVCARAGLLP